MNLLLIAGQECDGTGAVMLAGARAAHLVQVLKVVPGQSVRVGLLDGPMGTGIVRELAGGRVTLECTFDSLVPPRPAVDLLLALPRPKVLRRLWAQLAALGVGHIALTNAARVERNYFDTHVLHPACYEPLLVEGLQQARDTRLPRVSIHRQFRPLVEDELDDLSDASIRLAADPGGPTLHLADEPGGAETRVLLAVGPEGGWNTFERSRLAERGFRPFGLGPRALRSDTACIALLAVVQAALRQPSAART